MRVMVIIKPTKNGEAGVMPSVLKLRGVAVAARDATFQDAEDRLDESFDTRRDLRRA